MKYTTLSLLALLLNIAACKPKTVATAVPEKVILRFQLDSTGVITDAAVKKQLMDLAVQISKNADRIMLHSYTEKMNNPELENELATQQVRAAKEAMAQAPVPRVFYNVGIDIHGSLNPVDSIHPTNKINRRIEVEFL